ncbi:glycosyltransferase family 29 protein [Rhizobium azibense]|uniref:Glycosyl transferase family 29 (Putative sialyltransferase) n=1 Tax=Rhizobium azibense TaxID=1136135 RepID=A0A4R3RCR9_9HYPH|nr:glycosyltransferase family 29 protein [Rhizobium azibense]TCU32274.1 glycosyl transferase family 29 (putative sialyltransferase) [Rhizobium azibense]
MTREAFVRLLRQTGRTLDVIQRWMRFKITASPLNPWRIQSLNASAFAGKKVIIIGPAQTVVEDLENVVVDGYDVIVRLNNGIALARKNPSILGSRTDVLFHNLVEHGDRSAGAIPASLLREHGVRFLVFPHWGFKGSKSRLYKKREELQGFQGPALMVPSTRFCESVRRELGGFQPTVGASAILFFLSAQCKEVAIHGFTFFQTPYLVGYNDAVATADEARAWAAASYVHDPVREKKVIGRYISAAEQRGVRVGLGANVRRFLSDVR